MEDESGQITSLKVIDDFLTDANMGPAIEAWMAPLVAVNVITEDDRSLLVPDEFMQAANEVALQQWVSGGRKNYDLYKDEVAVHDARQVYAVPQSITELLKDAGKNTAISHANSKLIQQPSSLPNCIICVLHQRKMKLIVYRHHALQLVQDYAYTTPADACYHMLNAIQLSGLEANDITLVVGGMVDKDSALFKEVEKYFLNIEFLPLAPGISLKENFNEYPGHFFSHFSYMV